MYPRYLETNIAKYCIEVASVLDVYQSETESEIKDKLMNVRLLRKCC